MIYFEIISFVFLVNNKLENNKPSNDLFRIK